MTGALGLSGNDTLPREDNIVFAQEKQIRSFRADPFLEGNKCAKKETRSHESYPPCEKWRKMYQVYSVHLSSAFLFLNKLSLEKKFIRKIERLNVKRRRSR